MIADVVLADLAAPLAPHQSPRRCKSLPYLADLAALARAKPVATAKLESPPLLADLAALSALRQSPRLDTGQVTLR